MSKVFQLLAQMRRVFSLSMVLLLAVTTVSCGTVIPEETAQPTPSAAPSAAAPQTQLSDGQYPVQQVTYDDATGEYRTVLLNTPPGQPALFQVANLPMARLTDAEIAAGQKSYLRVEQGQPSLHLTEDFKIEYVHNVTETVTDPQTNQPQTVVVRQESNFWTPFAGALAGQAVANLLFTPHYYIPPIYQPGGPLVGYSSYGRTYNQAVNNYQTRYRTPPTEVRNRQTFRRTGRLALPSRAVTPSQQRQRDRAIGSGYGSSTLRRSNRSSPSRVRPRSGSFGSRSGARRSGGLRRR